MPTQGFTVTVGGTEADIERIEVQGSNVSLELEMDDYVSFGETVTVSYNPPAAGIIQDALGNQIGAIAADDFTVANNIPDPNETDPPEVNSVTVSEDGTTVQISFDEPVFFSTFPPGMVAMLDVSESTHDEITWTWLAPDEQEGVSGPVEWYEYRYRKSGGVWGSRTKITTTSVTVTDLDEETSYQIEVRAGNDGGGAGAGQTDTGRTVALLPAIPDALISRLSTNTFLSWQTAALRNVGIRAVSVKVELLGNGVWAVLSAQSGSRDYVYSGGASFTTIQLNTTRSTFPSGSFDIRVTFLDNNGLVISKTRVFTVT